MPKEYQKGDYCKEIKCQYLREMENGRKVICEECRAFQLLSMLDKRGMKVTDTKNAY